MGNDALRYPVDVISIVLDSDRPSRSPANDDVAYALVSRFNVRMNVGHHPRWSHIEGRNLIESADYEAFWLRRLELFERVCIPSVLNLTPKPDAWFIAFGDVDSWFVRELLDRLRPYPWIRPYFREKGHPNDAGSLPDLLGEFARSLGKPFLCSTRFDSDDSLQGQFIGGLDRAVSHLRERGFNDERRCLNFLYGLIESDGELSVFLRRSNMFESVFEPAGDIMGPYAGGHDEVRERMPLVEIVTNLPMWIYHRHGETLEPGWATARDRVRLTDLRAIYPRFGLQLAEDGPAADLLSDERNAANARGDERAFLPAAADSRSSVFWNAARLSEAADLAQAEGMSELALWLDPRKSEPVDLACVIGEIDLLQRPILNGPQLARLARELDASGETGLALRAYDYAVVAAPDDKHIRAERDALACELAARLDFDEQMDVQTEAGPIEPRSDSAVFIMSSCSDGGESEIPERALDYVGDLARSGYSVTILVAPAALPHVPLRTAPEGMTIEVLHPEPSLAAGSDAWHRELLRQFARRVSEIGPSLLVADGTSGAQRLAASIGRAWGIPVDFGVRDAGRWAEADTE